MHLVLPSEGAVPSCVLYICGIILVVHHDCSPSGECGVESSFYHTDTIMMDFFQMCNFMLQSTQIFLGCSNCATMSIAKSLMQKWILSPVLPFLIYKEKSQEIAHTKLFHVLPMATGTMHGINNAIVPRKSFILLSYFNHIVAILYLYCDYYCHIICILQIISDCSLRILLPYYAHIGPLHHPLHTLLPKRQIPHQMKDFYYPKVL